MDQSEFRAEIAEILREQDRRFERSQERLDQSEERLSRIEKLQEKNIEEINQLTQAVSKLEKVWTDFIDVYRFREQSAESKIEAVSFRVDRLEQARND